MTTRPPTWRPRRPEPATVRVRDPGGVVAAVPYLLGFVPRRSLVVVGVDDDRSVGATVRTDLPTAELRGPGEVLPAAWGHAGRLLRRNGCARALVVLYGEVDPADLPDVVARRLVEVVVPPPGRPGGGAPPAEPLLRGGLEVLDVLLVGPTRFRSLLCPDPSCCPVEGAPVQAAGSHPVAAAFVLAGRSPAPAREDVEPAPPPAEESESAAAAAATLRSRDALPGSPADARHDRGLLEEWLGCLPAGPTPELAGRLASRWRSNPMLRDSCLAAFLPGGPELARRLLGPGPSARLLGVRAPAPPARPRLSSGSSAGSLAGSLADPRCSTAVHDGASVLRRMAALVPAPETADVVAAHAWLSWASGEGTAAAVLAERALAVDPGQSLARLVLQCLDHGLGAPWTVRPFQAWQDPAWARDAG